ncbi:hypothetical protein Tco_0423630, partial [Tanacetum coccineum]
KCEVYALNVWCVGIKSLLNAASITAAQELQRKMLSVYYY